MVAGARVRLLLPDPPARNIFTDRWGFVSKDSETRTIADGPDSYPTSMRKWDKAFPNLGSLQFRTRG